MNLSSWWEVRTVLRINCILAERQATSRMFGKGADSLKGSSLTALTTSEVASDIGAGLFEVRTSAFEMGSTGSPGDFALLRFIVGVTAFGLS